MRSHFAPLVLALAACSETPLPIDDRESHCQNRLVNRDETDVDCGGHDCQPCENGSRCLAATDCIEAYCVNQVCTAGDCGTCLPANGTGKCVRGRCEIESCVMGFADCDKQSSTGC